MQTVAASVILEDAHRLMGEDVTQLDEPRREQEARTGLSLALQEVWEAWWWQELMTLSQQNLRDTYDSAKTYAAGDEVWWPGTNKYYQCIQASTGKKPEDTEYWIEARLSYTANNFAAAYYDYGELARDPASGVIYARIANGIKITGATNVLLAGIAETVFTKFPAGSYNTSVIPPDGGVVAAVGDSWQNGDPATYAFAFAIRYNATAKLWVLTSASAVHNVYGTSPTLVGTYSAEYNYALGASNNPAGTLSWVDAEAPPSTNWQAVSPFIPSLKTNRKVRMVSRLKPTQTNNPGEYNFIATADGIELTEIPATTPWIWARRVTPVLTGDDFSATATYTATDARELVFDS